MALIIIKIRDNDTGSVDISMESEPEFSFSDSKKMTDAQIVALGMLESATEAAETIHSFKAS